MKDSASADSELQPPALTASLPCSSHPAERGAGEGPAHRPEGRCLPGKKQPCEGHVARLQADSHSHRALLTTDGPQDHPQHLHRKYTHQQCACKYTPNLFTPKLLQPKYPPKLKCHNGPLKEKTKTSNSCTTINCARQVHYFPEQQFFHGSHGDHQRR